MTGLGGGGGGVGAAEAGGSRGGQGVLQVSSFSVPKDRGGGAAAAWRDLVCVGRQTQTPEYKNRVSEQGKDKQWVEGEGSKVCLESTKAARLLFINSSRTWRRAYCPSGAD